MDTGNVRKFSLTSTEMAEDHGGMSGLDVSRGH